MPAEKALALVIRYVDFSESSAILTLFTREFGKIGALAKGAKRPKGPFENALDLLNVCRIVFLRKSSGGLDLLTEARLERWFRPRDRDLTRLYAAYYVAELLGELTQEYDPHPELFDLAEVTLEALSSKNDPGSHLLHFELAAMRILGHFPSLEVCSECGAPIAPRERVAFGLHEGGALCARCKLGKRGIVSLSQPAWTVLLKLADVQPSWEAFPLAPGVRGEVRGLVSRYVSHVLGKKPRLHDYLSYRSPSSLGIGVRN
jgi:DNA repair protein RecO (recombination protein O)